MIKVHGADVEFLKFSAGEPHVKVRNVNEYVAIRWDFENFEEFMYIAMICDVIKGAGGCAVGLHIPYVPFGRQDRRTTPEQPFSLEVFCKMLKTLKITKLTVCDSHSEVFFELIKDAPFTVKNYPQIYCANLAFDFSAHYGSYDCIIAPDKGAVIKAKKFLAGLNKPLICATKVRDPLTGKLSAPMIDFGDLKPKRALIPDDILDYGGTFLQLADVIKEQFPDIVLDLYVTHGIFAAGDEELNKRFDNIYCYNDFRKFKGEKNAK